MLKRQHPNGEDKRWSARAQRPARIRIILSRWCHKYLGSATIAVVANAYLIALIHHLSQDADHVREIFASVFCLGQLIITQPIPDKLRGLMTFTPIYAFALARIRLACRVL